MKLLPLSLVSLAAATPLGSLEERQSTTLCGQYSYWSGNGYEVLNNLWGKDAATSGSQCKSPPDYPLHARSESLQVLLTQ